MIIYQRKRNYLRKLDIFPGLKTEHDAWPRTHTRGTSWHRDSVALNPSETECLLPTRDPNRCPGSSSLSLDLVIFWSHLGGRHPRRRCARPRTPQEGLGTCRASKRKTRATSGRKERPPKYNGARDIRDTKTGFETSPPLLSSRRYPARGMMRGPGEAHALGPRHDT